MDVSRIEPHELEKVFDPFASAFDDVLVRMLDYRGPQVVGALVELHAEMRGANVLDLGCGTGLVGVVLKAAGAGMIDGVDLSRRMLDQARASGAYGNLMRDDITSLVAGRLYDVVTCADAAPYLGDLERLYATACRAMRRGGVFILTVQHRKPYEGKPFELDAKTRRFSHARAYLIDLALEFGLDVLQMSEKPLRIENGKPDPFLTFAMRKP